MKKTDKPHSNRSTDTDNEELVDFIDLRASAMRELSEATLAGVAGGCIGNPSWADCIA